MPATYREQYDRMKRWYDRFVAFDQGRPHDVPSDNYLDEIYAFFLNCYHLKDWIKHDGTVATIVQQAVEPHINSSRPLKLCGDICNSLKHVRLTSTRSGERPAFGKKQFALTLGTAPTTINLKYEGNTTSGPLAPMTMYGQKEYIGRALNVACRLQTSIKDKDDSPAYKALVSNGVFNKYFSTVRGVTIRKVRRTLRNIRGGVDFHCRKIELLRSSAT